MGNDVHIGDDISLGSYEDRELAKDLYARFYQATDNNRFQEWAECFAEDGWIDYPTASRITGRAALERFVQGNTVWASEHGYPRTRHHVSNLRITLEGNRGRGQCYVAVWWVKEDRTLQFCTIGGYEDELVKVGGRWYFQSRLGWSDADIPTMYGVEYAEGNTR
jgi:3-phenylpropionate/cinnamic acid dioxygenase small subunit